MSLDEIQAAVKSWTLKNFGPPVFPFHRPLLGAMEELGELTEVHQLGLSGQKRRTRKATQTALNKAIAAAGRLCHAHLKKEQGIRGSKEDLEAKARDAIGDVIVYLMDYCNSHEWNLQQIVEETWQGVVQKRDWKQNPTDGISR